VTTQRLPLEPTLTSGSAFADLLPTPPKASTVWGPFVLHVADVPLHLSATFGDHVLGLHISGRHRLRQEIEGQVIERISEPGATSLIPANQKVTTEASGPLCAAVLFVPHAFLSRVIAEHWEADPRNVEIVRQTAVRDSVVKSVVTNLVLEEQRGSPSGHLYAESACEFLAHHIVHMYSSLAAHPPRRSGGLPAHALNRILDYVEENLAQRIALQQLSALAGVSARHFERAFRQAVGVPPHEYVLQRRIDSAQHLLLSRSKFTVGEIAARVGFSSSSHLAHAFRRNTGYSPTAYRRLQSR
jgi:AraC family transcriptional regulator